MCCRRSAKINNSAEARGKINNTGAKQNHRCGYSLAFFSVKSSLLDTYSDIEM